MLIKTRYQSPPWHHDDEEDMVGSDENGSKVVHLGPCSSRGGMSGSDSESTKKSSRRLESFLY